MFCTRHCQTLGCETCHQLSVVYGGSHQTEEGVVEASRADRVESVGGEKLAEPRS